MQDGQIGWTRDLWNIGYPSLTTPIPLKSKKILFQRQSSEFKFTPTKRRLTTSHLPILCQCRNPFFTILQDKLHSLTIQDDRSTRFLCTTNYRIDQIIKLFHEENSIMSRLFSEFTRSLYSRQHCNLHVTIRCIVLHFTCSFLNEWQKFRREKRVHGLEVIAKDWIEWIRKKQHKDRAIVDS